MVSVKTRVRTLVIQRMHILEKPKSSPCANCVKKGHNLKSYFVLEASKSKALNESKPKAPKPKVLNSSKHRTLNNSR